MKKIIMVLLVLSLSTLAMAKNFHPEHVKNSKEVANFYIHKFSNGTEDMKKFINEILEEVKAFNGDETDTWEFIKWACDQYFWDLTRDIDKEKTDESN